MVLSSAVLSDNAHDDERRAEIAVQSTTTTRELLAQEDNDSIPFATDDTMLQRSFGTARSRLVRDVDWWQMAVGCLGRVESHVLAVDTS